MQVNDTHHTLSKVLAGSHQDVHQSCVEQVAASRGKMYFLEKQAATMHSNDYQFLLFSIFYIRRKYWNSGSIRLRFLTDLHVLGCSEHDFTTFTKCLSVCLSVCDTNFLAALPYWKSFINQYQSYATTSMFHISSGVFFYWLK